MELQQRRPASDGRPSWLADPEPRAAAYRPDIDGLRAIAVMSVVLFHVRASLLPGGFAGVDVFFVISGYLITTIVHREIAAGEFSIARFYERRIRRIYPALMAVLGATLIAGLAILMPEELKDLGSSIVATILFCSNFLFSSKVDYFADAAELQPLLHTWSLAVEEQFYLALPVLLLAIHRLAPKLVRPAIALLLLMSFAMSCAWVWISASSNYYLPHTRAWELLVGSALAVGLVPGIRNRIVNETVAAAGLAAIVIPFFLLTDRLPFPAWNAVPICFGTAALIHTGRHHATVVSRLLALKPCVWIGLISYSVYLVHFPLIAFTRYHLLRSPSLNECAVLVAASLFLGWASWRFIERPFRRRSRLPRRVVFRLAAGMSVAFAAAGVTIVTLDGLPRRTVLVDAPSRWRSLTPQAVRVAAYTDYRDTADYRQQFRRGHCFVGEGEPFSYAECFRLSPSKPDLVVLGDSHAAQYWRAIADELPGWNVLQATASGCRPLLNSPGRASCRAVTTRVMSDLVNAGKVDAVVLAGRWAARDLPYLPATVRQIEGQGIPVVVIGPTVEYNVPAPLIFARAMLGGADPQGHVSKTRWSMEHDVRASVVGAGAHYVSALSIECPQGRCRTITPDGAPMQFDYGHLTLSGSRQVVDSMGLPKLLPVPQSSGRVPEGGDRGRYAPSGRGRPAHHPRSA